MLSSALIGILAGGLAFLSRFLSQKLSASLWISGAFWNIFLALSAVTFGIILLFRFLQQEKRPYLGFSDFIVSIHLPEERQRPGLWGFRGLISFFFSCFNGVVGTEGPVIEWIFAFRKRSSPQSIQWLEDRRRNDVALSFASAIAGVFGAPFAALILPQELGIGGKSLSVGICGLMAFLTSQFLSNAFGLVTPEIGELLTNFHVAHWREWVSAATIAFFGIGFGLFVTFWLNYVRNGFDDFFHLKRAWAPEVRFLISALLLLGMFYFTPVKESSSFHLFEQALWDHYTSSEIVLLFVTQLLSLSLVLGAFGTAGVLWPLVMLGAIGGVGINHFILQQGIHFSAVAGLLGSVVMLATVLGIPLTGALLAFEWTHHPGVLLFCLIFGFAASLVRKKLYSRSFLEKDLQRIGLTLLAGRSKSVLESIPVSAVMVTDFESIQEHEPLDEVEKKLYHSRYPFLPVVDEAGECLGLLTVDAVYESQRGIRVLEARDILSRQPQQSLVALDSQFLSEVVHYFDSTPCIAVLNSDRKMRGLLFVYSIRLAYDREVARRSFSFVRQSKLNDKV